MKCRNDAKAPCVNYATAENKLVVMRSRYVARITMRYIERSVPVERGNIIGYTTL
jgi:hypothetical protein